MLILLTTNILETYSFTFITKSSLFKVLQFSNFFNGATAPTLAQAALFLRFHDHTQDTPRSVGLLQTSDRPVSETST